MSGRPVERQEERRQSAAVGPDGVPRRLRDARERAGVSLRQLAQRLDISASALSQIETGKSRPSVRTLYAIVSELNLSLDELFAHRPQASPIAKRATAAAGPVVHPEERSRLELDSGVFWDQLTRGHDPLVDFLYVTYAPGSASNGERALVRHSGHEYGIVLRGAIDVTIGFDTYRCEAGDAVSFRSDEPHLLSNAGDEPATAIWVVVGRRGMDRP